MRGSDVQRDATTFVASIEKASAIFPGGPPVLECEVRGSARVDPEILKERAVADRFRDSVRDALWRSGDSSRDPFHRREGWRVRSNRTSNRNSQWSKPFLSAQAPFRDPPRKAEY